MSFEYSIIKDFYDCCNVPIKLINYELEDLCKIGYTDFFDRIYPLEEIKINIKNSATIMPITLIIFFIFLPPNYYSQSIHLL